MDAEIQRLLERGVAALEKLTEDPVVHMETGPPVCPHCDRMNPTVRVEESEETGPLGEFVIRCHCTHCNRVFYAIPIQWVCCHDVSEVESVINEKAALSGFSSLGTD